VFLALGDGKTEGVLDLEELRNEAGDIKVAVGDEVEARRVTKIGPSPLPGDARRCAYVA
jgi:ribosomal protein S1